MFAWQQRRSQLNHDWLKNKYLPALEKLLNLLDDHLEDPEFERGFVSGHLPAWEQQRAEAVRLVEDFEPEMSPRLHLDRLPLSLHDEETRHWLANAVHSLWLARHPVRQWVVEARERANEVEAAYRQLREQLQACPDTISAASLRPLRALFDQFRRSCQNLARAFERFPCEVIVA